MTTYLEIRDEGKMTAEQLKKNLDAGELVTAQVSDRGEIVVIKRATYPNTGIECYAMRGRYGLHCLNADATDAARLLAHWRGFIENCRR